MVRPGACSASVRAVEHGGKQHALQRRTCLRTAALVVIGAAVLANGARCREAPDGRRSAGLRRPRPAGPAAQLAGLSGATRDAAARPVLRLRGSGDDPTEMEMEHDNRDAPVEDPTDLSSFKMKKALEKLDQMRLESEDARNKKIARDQATYEYAVEAAKNISKGYTMYGKPGVWYDDYSTRNASCRDPFTDLDADGKNMAGSWAFYENRPVPFIPETMPKDNTTRTRLVPREALSWRLPSGVIAPQYGNAVGGMGYGTRSVGLDEVDKGMLYTNESYDPDGEWRAQDEAFVQKIKDERKVFGEDWYRYIPEELADYQALQAIEAGETEDMWNAGMLDAAIEGNNIKLREFMAKGANVDCIDTRVEWAAHGRAHGNYRALHYAAMFGHRRTVEWLLAYGAFVAPRNSPQETPLHLAAAAGNWECARTLLKSGAPVDAQDACGWTPLFKAIFFNATSKITRDLLKFGADINHLDQSGRAAVDVARYWNMTKQVKQLKALGSKPPHVPGRYRGSAAEEAGVIKKGSKVVLSAEAARIFEYPLKDDVVANEVLPLPQLCERTEPYFKFVDCLNITKRQREKLLNVYGDTHDGPLLPGVVGTVTECNWEFKSDGHKWAKIPYCVSVSFGDDREALERWGEKAVRDDLDSDEESVDPEDIVHDEWIKGSANDIKWWYPASAVRLATQDEASSCMTVGSAASLNEGGERAGGDECNLGCEGSGSHSSKMEDALDQAVASADAVAVSDTGGSMEDLD